MNKFLLLLFIVFAVSCNNDSNKKQGDIADNKKKESKMENKTESVKDKSFDELFIKVEAVELNDNVFKLVGSDFMLITAGDENHYNSMTAGWGGWGILFNKPSTWCFLRANRYTLELMKQHKTYTLAYFPDEYKEQVLYFGSISGRNTDKMKNASLSQVVTPNGNMAYKEAKLILECSLFEVSTVNPNDFYTEEGKKFAEEGFVDAKDYHKIVFGQITGIWVKR